MFEPEPSNRRFVIRYAHAAALRESGPYLNLRLYNPMDRDCFADDMFALLDTGASATCVRQSVLKDLGTQYPHGVMTARLPGSSDEGPYPFYYVGMSLSADNGVLGEFPFVEVLAVPDNAIAQDFTAIIGRDFLENVEMSYDGTAGVIGLELRNHRR